MHTYVYIYILLQLNPFQVNIYWLLIGSQEDKRTAHTQDKVSGILSHASLKVFLHDQFFKELYNFILFSPLLIVTTIQKFGAKVSYAYQGCIYFF